MSYVSPVRIIMCPDSFTGTMSAAEAATSMRDGWLEARPRDEVFVLPLSDGGPGFVSALSEALETEPMSVSVSDPLGRQIEAALLIVGETAYIESAQACGLHLLELADRDPQFTSTYGVGQLIDYAIAQGAKRIVVGLGGSSTNDAGAGLLCALGARAFDSTGADCTHLLANGGLGLRDIDRVELSAALARVEGIEIEVATDVDNPLLGLRGATNTYAAQKGADTAAVMTLEGSLAHFSERIGRRADGKNAAVALGAGAAGGLGFALVHLGGNRSSGIDRILQLSGLEEQIPRADLVVTGEGSFDWQSLSGKVINGVSKVALNAGVPVVVIAGHIDLGRREWQTIGVHGVYSLVEMYGESDSLTQPQATLRAATARVARTWGR